MTLLDSIRDAAQRMIAQRELDALMRTSRHLLSAQGEANSAGLAAQVIDHYRKLPEAAHLSFFEALAAGFNPDPIEVLASAKRYAESQHAEALPPFSFLSVMRPSHPAAEGRNRVLPARITCQCPYRRWPSYRRPSVFATKLS